MPYIAQSAETLILGSYDWRLVTASVVVAVTASYVALVLAARLTGTKGFARLCWLFGGALALGVGIWAMHFVGMLAFRLGDLPIVYDLPNLILSVVVAVAASALALLAASRREVSTASLILPGLLMGAAIAGMHYIGMAGMHTGASLTYVPWLVVASVIIAVAASGVALLLATQLRGDEAPRTQWWRRAAACAMGGAIAGMHYTAMGAAQFHSFDGAPATLRQNALLATDGLAIAVVVAAALPLGLSLLGSLVNRHFTALAAREARYRSLVEATAAVLWTTDDTGRFETPQPEWVAFTGTPADPMAVGWLGAVYGDDRQRISQIWRQALDMGRAMDEQHRLTRADGSVIQARVRAVPVRGDGGRILEWVGVHIDVSERHAADARLRQVESQLLQAQKLESIGRLAGGIAHDFNNLLTVITGTSQLAAESAPSGSQLARDLSAIQSASERATALTRQLLAFSRRQTLRAELIDLNSVVRRMQELLQRLIGDDVRLFTSLGATVGAVVADETQIEQVLLNLAINARDAMPEGGALTIETQNVDLDREYAGTHLGVEDGPYVMLAVCDTGVGMDAVTQAQIFEPFFTTKPVGQGTGLGLATVYGIVKQSRGSIFVYSEPGHGAVFKIYLPRATASTLPGVVLPSMPPATGDEVVLLAEDSPDVRAFTARVLRDAGFLVIEARDADEAVQIAAAHAGPLDVLVADVVMPGRSGKELVAGVRAAHPKIGIVLMSGYTDDAVAQRGILEPGVLFVQKPFSAALLTQRVREVLDGRDRDTRILA